MLHKDSHVGFQHIIHNWLAADEAARLALSLLPADIGKVALQSDTNALWVLLDDAVPLWKDLTSSTTSADVRGTVLTGLSVASKADVTAADSILAAIGKLQARSAVALVKVIPIACSDEATALTAGGSKVTFRMPFALELSDVRASLTTAQTSGGLLTVDVNQGGSTILSTKLTIDNTEKTSTTAVVARVISVTSLTDDAEITIDIDSIGDGTARGLKVYLIGV